ncbi:hypothetical protein ACIQNG_04030 [Streptomyces sp. NPDC091377]|uniref:hypothetical protein n=1 Tax=Streptomyces sp. NPDC091377 TaxID=3365995 RepID=UPI0038020006
MDSEGHVCPVCGQSVETVVRRHKTLGAWVPQWVAGPCRNSGCAAYVEDEAERGQGPAPGAEVPATGARSPAGAPAPPPGTTHAAPSGPKTSGPRTR